MKTQELSSNTCTTQRLKSSREVSSTTHTQKRGEQNLECKYNKVIFCQQPNEETRTLQMCSLCQLLHISSQLNKLIKMTEYYNEPRRRW